MPARQVRVPPSSWSVAMAGSTVGAMVGSTSRLSDSHIVEASLAGCGPACPGRSKRADMTGQRGPRQAVATPGGHDGDRARDGDRAPRRARGDGTAADPAITTACAPPPGGCRWWWTRRARRRSPARAAASTRPRGTAGDGGGRGTGAEDRQQHADGAAQHRPGGDHGRQAGQGGQRQGAGQRDQPLAGDGEILHGQGRGGVKMACAQACRADSTISPARSPPAAGRRRTPCAVRTCQLAAGWPLTASSTPASKQVRSPVWQAAPTWSTLTPGRRRRSPAPPT